MPNSPYYSVANIQPIKCDMCQGTGYIDWENGQNPNIINRQRCETCNGTGLVNDNQYGGKLKNNKKYKKYKKSKKYKIIKNNKTKRLKLSL